MARRELSFGPFRLDLDQNELWRGDERIDVQARTLAVLRHLAERPGQLVTKVDLLADVWGGLRVGQSTVKVAVRAVRELLDDAAAAPRYVETVGREGYRFIGTLPADDAERAGGAGGLPGAAARRPAARPVGREAERAALGQILERARRGVPQIVFVTGEAGIGKTTLVDEFVAGVRAPMAPRTALGQCLEHYGTGEAYLPLHDAIARLCRGPDRAEVLAVLRQQAPSWLAHLPGLLSEDDRAAHPPAPTTHERLLREIADALLALALARPFVLVLEDLHWSDHSTVELIAHLAQRRDDAQLVVVGTYRPTDLIVRQHPLHDAKSELDAKGLCVELPLELLSEAEVAGYLGQCMKDGIEAATLARAVHDRTEGNPLFMVNVVDELTTEGVLTTEGGTWHLRGAADALGRVIPTGVRALIEKQVRRLGAEQQEVLEAASVAGKEFAAASVAAGVRHDPDLVDDVCEELAARAQLIEEVGVAEWPDGTESGRYRFRHALYAEVLAGRIAATRRRRIHGLIGRREEAAWGARVPEHASALAAHFDAARDTPRAARYHALAAEAAAGRSSHHEAAWHFKRALAVRDADGRTAAPPEQELGLRMGLGMALTATRGYAAPEVEREFRRALALSAAIDDSPRLLPAFRGLREFYILRGDLARARSFAERLVRIAEQDGDPVLLGEAHFGVGTACFYQGELAAARERFERSLTAHDPRRRRTDAVAYGHDPAATSLSELAFVLWSLGYPDQARARSAEAIALVEELSHPFGVAHALAFDAFLHQVLGEPATVRARGEAVAAIAREHGFPHWLAMATMIEGWLLADAGRAEDGAARLRAGLAAFGAMGVELGLSYYRSLLAHALAAGGHVDEGLALIRKELGRIARSGERFHEAELRRAEGELVLAAAEERAPGGRASETRGTARRARPAALPKRAVAAAERCFRTALEAARGREARSQALRAALSLGRLWQRQERPAEARALVAETHATFTEGLETADLRAARRLLDELA